MATVGVLTHQHMPLSGLFVCQQWLVSC